MESINIKGNDTSGHSIGGLIGSNNESTTGKISLENCSASNIDLSGYSRIGGLIGNFDDSGKSVGEIKNCFVAGTISISATDGIIGGLAGFYNGSISTSFVSGDGDIVAKSNAGGLVSVCFGDITNCYSIINVSSNYMGGGLAGLVINGKIISSYFAGNVSGTSIGGIAGVCKDGVIDCIYLDTVGGDAVLNDMGKSSSDENMKKIETYQIPIVDTSWNITDGTTGDFVWFIKEGTDYPKLSPESPTGMIYISTVKDFKKIGTDYEDPKTGFIYTLDADYALRNELDFSGVTLTPIGTVSEPFTGTFDGRGKEISGVKINMDSDDHVGIFGYADGAVFSNVILKGIDITGKDYVGGLLGYSEDCTISSSSISDSTITGNDYVGGLLGHSEDCTISSSSISDSTITGNDYVGGFAGSMTGKLSLSFSSDDVFVNGKNYVGGLFGEFDGEIVNSYSTAQINGEDHVGGLVGISSSSSDPIKISFSYFAGRISGENIPGNSKFGSLLGYTMNPSAEIKNCIYLDTALDVIVSSETVFGTAVSGQNMKKMNSYLEMGSYVEKDWSISEMKENGFDPLSTWYILDGKTYPQLSSLRIDTIYISTPEELQRIGSDYYDAVNDKHYTLNANYILINSIDLSDFNFEPIGTKDEPFIGTFNGRGYTISNLNIETAASMSVYSGMQKMRHLEISY